MCEVPHFLPTTIVCVPPGNSESQVSLWVLYPSKGTVVTYSFYQVGIITPFYRVSGKTERGKKYRERKWFAWGHIATKWLSWALNPGFPALDYTMLIPGHGERLAVLPKPRDGSRRPGSLPALHWPPVSQPGALVTFRVLSSPGNQQLSKSLDLCPIQKFRQWISRWPLRDLPALTFYRPGRGEEPNSFQCVIHWAFESPSNSGAAMSSPDPVLYVGELQVILFAKKALFLKTNRQK